ncbi:unnamed protein product [Rotaria magnacalcarata]|uniref:Uncharacterized protein n=1 Tax=Rotaria magnacalcarata TaxID=392030 RepID=A0A815S3Q5_9BILA|nr:unnamed protein product [Rotaria magnacalcarata]CAF4533333.1 unnamed protein product [Rotaria magnacalcarata]
MKQATQQPLSVHHLDKNSLVLWRKTQPNYAFDWNSYSNEQQEYRIPIIEPLSTIEKPYCFDQKKKSTKSHIIIIENPINDYFKLSLFACLSCFWMLAGIICLHQSIKIRRLLKKRDQQSEDKARLLSNCLHTNLILTYVFGGIIIGVLVMTVLVTFVVGLKGYFSKSL